MTNLDSDGEVEIYQTKGYYFRPKSHICKHYLIEVLVIEASVNARVSVYEIGIPQKGGNELILGNGDQIATSEVDQVVEIALMSKYFFPKFTSDSYQWYHNESHQNGIWEYDDNGNMDEIMAMAEAMKYAVALGLKVAQIEPQ